MAASYPAHIRIVKTNGIVREYEQDVAEHCRQAAEWAAVALSCVGLGKTAYLAALLHDSGKATAAFREYIEKAAHGEPVRRGSVNHTFTGVRMLLERYHGPDPGRYADVTCELMAYAVGAHHGLFDCVDERRQHGFTRRLYKEDIGYEEAYRYFVAKIDLRELDALFQQADTELGPVFCRLNAMAKTNDELSFYIGLLARLLLSAVVEGDRRNTAEFERGAPLPLTPMEPEVLWPACLKRMERKLGELPVRSPVQKARATISRRCRDFAERPGAVYRLNVPTGGGKTLSSLRYALAHAARWRKAHIIFVLPLLAIIEQNAQEIRNYVQDDDLILEHHSDVVNTEQQDEADRRELLVQTWDAPIIVTTLVQLLNTLFSGQRLHPALSFALRQRHRHRRGANRSRADVDPVQPGG